MDKLDRILEALTSLEQRLTDVNQLAKDLKREQEELKNATSGLLEMLTRTAGRYLH
ncbi:hypothetical protein [Alicyclobacillus sp. SP_1]|uniref:hypothetical protein n=1 Tax=Alicyclobacillus sp. SP_1 TaxID=2942475 RepID=UPI00215822F4|nr:hypothetical protein [Alicyclobacillus sp. SP_1]